MLWHGSGGVVDRSFDRARAARACSLIGGKAAYIGEKRGGGGLYRGKEGGRRLL